MCARGQGKRKRRERRERKNEESELRGPESRPPETKNGQHRVFCCFSSFFSAFLLSTYHVLIDQHVHLISSLVEAEFVHETGSRSAENRCKLMRKKETQRNSPKNKAKPSQIRAEFDSRCAH